MQPDIVNNIFKIEGEDITKPVFEVFDFQYHNNKVYRQWCDLIRGGASKTEPGIQVIPASGDSVAAVPFLPISFFKTLAVTSTLFEPEIIFESSGTTQTVNSKHLVKEKDIYQQSFVKAFEMFYGKIEDWCVLGLLPAYLERKGSSLVLMVDEMIKMSNQPDSGFYLYDFDKLAETLKKLEAAGQKTLLIGVTFALLDFAEAHPMHLQHTVIMETGGMKGRKREMTRQEVHGFLQEKLGVEKIHSEYGMTELLSQAYSKGDGRFVCPPWMKVVVRDEEDPLHVSLSGKGILNVIDLANIYSCSFIATDDVGIVYEDGSFEVLGRLDNSDIRGCSLLVV